MKKWSIAVIEQEAHKMRQEYLVIPESVSEPRKVRIRNNLLPTEKPNSEPGDFTRRKALL